MQTTYCRVVAGVILILTGINLAFSQSGPEFINCPSAPISLCVNDPGVRLPANNQIYSSEADTNATSCSVHVTLSIKVKSNCGHQLQYGVQLFLDDTSSAYTLQPLKMINTDSLDEADLIFNSELSPVEFIRKNGIPYNTGCMPYHRIKWIVIDSCGSINECEELIDLYDCQAPKIDTLSGITNLTIPIGCQLYLYAEDFRSRLLDDCSPEDSFIYSLQQDTFRPYKYLDPCSVSYGVEVPLDIWAADEGRDIDCNGAIEWMERNKYKETVTVVYHVLNSGCVECEDEIVIQGNILTEDLQTVQMASVNLENPGHLYPTYFTTQDGKYEFGHIILPANVTISAERDDNHKNGVSTLDLVRIQKHLLGIEKLTSPYDLIAADANNSQRVSAIDLVELRKLILGIYSKLPNNKSWRFFVHDTTPLDTMNPWPFKETITLAVSGSIYDADFIAIKVGDVNNTVQAHTQALVTREAYRPAAFTIAPMTYEANEIVNIDFSIDDLKSLNGFQFTLSDPDLEFLGASSNLIDLTEDDYALFDDKMTMSWFSLEELSIDPSQIVFTIKARAKNSGHLEQNLQLNSDITDAELYSADETFIPKILVKTNDEDPLVLMAPKPNPWSTTCTIPFHMQNEGILIFTIYDMDGAKTFSEDKYYPAGYHEMELNADDMHADGLLFYTLQNETKSQSGKFVFLGNKEGH